MPKRAPFFVSNSERTGVLLTLLVLCIVKWLEPSVLRIVRARYDQVIQWNITDTIYIDKTNTDSKGVIRSAVPRSTTALASKYSRQARIMRPGDLGDINRADTAQLKRIYGIGSVLARRIVKYRSALGHFVAMEQLQEVYHLPDSVYFKLKMRFSLDTIALKKIAINKASAQELAALPYLSSEEIKWVIDVRDAQKGFATRKELTNLFIETLNKKPFILLYLTL